VQAVELLVLVKVPAAHEGHEVAALVELKVPGRQDTHRDDDVPAVVTPLLDVPAVQEVQLAEPAGL
jgi:hypothetical protein